jgi:hypothetical protein
VTKVPFLHASSTVLVGSWRPTPACEHGFALRRAKATIVAYCLTGIVKPYPGLTMYNYGSYGIDF